MLRSALGKVVLTSATNNINILAHGFKRRSQGREVNPRYCNISPVAGPPTHHMPPPTKVSMAGEVVEQVECLPYIRPTRAQSSESHMDPSELLKVILNAESGESPLYS